MFTCNQHQFTTHCIVV